MSRKLRIPNPDLTQTEKTYLDADYSSGTALTVVNNYGFANDDIAIVGEIGEEKTESKDVTGQTGNEQIDISAALKFDHNKNTPVYRYEYDQYEIYRYRSSAWTLISTSNIQWDKRETIYIDASGLSTDSYRYRLKNSASSATSDYSPTIAATGFTRQQVGYILRQVRKVFGDEERRIVKDAELIRLINEAQEIIYTKRNDWWFLRAEDSNITTIANTNTYGLATHLPDLSYIDTVRYRYNDGTTDVTFHLKNEPAIELDYKVRDNDQTSDDYPESYTILPPDDSDSVGYIMIDKPSKTTGYGTFYIRYYKTMTDVDDVADETLVPIPSIIEDFLLEYCYRLKGDSVKAEIYKEKFWGPQPGQDSRYKEPVGLRLLEIMQSQKGKASGQPESLKKFRGQKAMRRLFTDHSVDRDSLVERYF